MLIRELTEADEPKRKAADAKRSQATADVKDKPDVDLGKMFEPKADQPMAKVEPPKGKTDEPKAAAEPEIKKASAAKTAAAMGRVTPTDQMRDMLGRINVPDELIAQEPELPTDTDEIEPVPPPPANVPGGMNTPSEVAIRRAEGGKNVEVTSVWMFSRGKAPMFAFF